MHDTRHNQHQLIKSDNPSDKISKVGLCKFMFETWTHKLEKSHTLYEWKVGIQQNPFNFIHHFIKPTFAFFVSQSKAYLVLNGRLYFLPDQFRQ